MIKMYITNSKNQIYWIKYLINKDFRISVAMSFLYVIILYDYFYLYNLLNLIFMLIDDWGNYRTDYSVCSTCVTNPSKCKV